MLFPQLLLAQAVGLPFPQLLLAQAVGLLLAVALAGKEAFKSERKRARRSKLRLLACAAVSVACVVQLGRCLNSVRLAPYAVPALMPALMPAPMFRRWLTFLPHSRSPSAPPRQSNIDTRKGPGRPHSAVPFVTFFQSWCRCIVLFPQVLLRRQPASQKGKC